MADRRPRNWPSIAGSQRERATEAFRRLEDMTRLISDWVWETDTNGKLTYVSERIIDRLGVHPVQVIGKRLDEVGRFELGEVETEGPDMRRPFRDARYRAIGHDSKDRHFTMSGLPRFHHSTGEFVGSTGIAKDVTELVRVERANMRLADAIEVLSGYFALYDENDRLVISNARFREFNKEFGEAARPGGNFEDLLRLEVESGRYPDALSAEDRWIKRRLSHRRQTSGPFEIELENGRWLYVDEERLPEGGNVTMSRDITDIKRAMSALKDSEETHREFAASVAHKLRTPLAVLRSNLDSISENPEVEALKREVDSLARMVEQLLTLTRYEYLVLPSDAEADLRGVAIQVISRLAPEAIKDGRILELDAPDHPIMIHGSAGALEHALRNLLENAIKYSARGAAVTLVLEETPPTIHVIDQGRGIPAEKRSQLFERFSRADRRGSGAGLGLTIVKAVADAHDADISVRENQDGGSVFTITFPLMERSRTVASRI